MCTAIIEIIIFQANTECYNWRIIDTITYPKHIKIDKGKVMIFGKFLAVLYLYSVYSKI